MNSPKLAHDQSPLWTGVATGVSRYPCARAFAWLLVFFAILCPRLGQIRDYGFAHPYWDQWHSEGVQLIRPWLSSELNVADLFAPNSEHRIALTRVVQLLLLTTDGQWDGLTQQVTNAVVFALLATWLLALTWPRTGSETRIPTFLLGVVFLLPIGWANTLWGFQSQFYFLIFGSLLAIAQVCRSEPLHAKWWLAFALSVASFLGMAGGLLTAGVCSLIQVLRAATERESRKAHGIATFCWVTLFAVLAWWTPTVKGNTVRAASLVDFTNSFGKNLAFPFLDQRWAVIVPGTVLVCFASILLPNARRRWTPIDRIMLGVLLWVSGQATAIAYSRGAGGAAPTHRYFDVLQLLAPASLVLLWRMPSIFRWKKGWRWRIRAPVLGLAAAYTLAFARVIRETENYWLPQHNAEFAVQETNLREVIRTHNFTHFGNLPPNETSSYLSVADMEKLLVPLAMSEVLAPSIREPWEAPVGTPSPVEPGEVPLLVPIGTNFNRFSFFIVSFDLDHAPDWNYQWQAMRYGAMLVAGPRFAHSTRWSLISMTRYASDESLHRLLTEIGATHVLRPRDIGALGVVARLWITWPVALAIAVVVLLLVASLCWPVQLSSPRK